MENFIFIRKFGLFDAIVISIILIVAIVGFSIKLLVKPDFKQFNTKIQKIEFIEYGTNGQKVITITDTSLINTFREDLICCSRIKNFETDHYINGYDVKIYANGKNISIDMGGTVHGFFTIIIDGRRFSNQRIQEFVHLHIKSFSQTE